MVPVSVGQDEEPSLVNTSLPAQLSSASSPTASSLKNPNSLDTPFHMLPAECILNCTEFLARPSGDDLYCPYTIRTLAILSNYRFFVQFSQVKNKCRLSTTHTNNRPPPMAFYNILLRCIESVEIREIFYLYVFCKDGRVAKIAFDNNENGIYWFRLVSEASQPPKSLHDLFAFYFHIRCQKNALTSASLTVESPSDELNEESCVREEFKRINFDERYWRISRVNAADYKVCPTYPKYWITPANVTDDELEAASRYRCLRRVAAVVWRHKENGAVLIRSSQPESGIFGWRSPADEHLLQCIGETARRDCPKSGRMGDTTDESCSATKPLLILDARSYAAAWANKAKGGGFENKENYHNCEIQFLGLANIHAIRYSFQKLRAILWDSNNYASSSGAGNQPGGTYAANGWASSEASFLQNLDACQWPQHLWALLNSSARVVDALHVQGRCVLVHCSDGWDRTTQIIALAKLMLDPYYRTLQGFKCLVEREWIDFGHKFAERSGLMPAGDPNQRAPVFLQWLDCIRYLLREYPCSFEFNEIYLVKLAQHTYSALFGTFLCNSAREFHAHRVAHRTFSVWTYLNDPDRRSFINLLYAPHGLHHRHFFGPSSTCPGNASDGPLSNPTSLLDDTVQLRSVACSQVLTPRIHVRDLAQVWRQVCQPPDDPSYWRPLRGLAASAPSIVHLSSSSLLSASLHTDDEASSAATTAKGLERCQRHAAPVVPKTHLCDDLLKVKNLTYPVELEVAKRSTDSGDKVSNLSLQSPLLQRSSSESTLRWTARVVDALFHVSTDTSSGRRPIVSGSSPSLTPATGINLTNAVSFTNHHGSDNGVNTGLSSASAACGDWPTASSKSSGGRIDFLLEVPTRQMMIALLSGSKFMPRRCPMCIAARSSAIFPDSTDVHEK